MPIKLPFYAKASLLLVGLYSLVSMLYIAQGLIVPFIFAVILSIVLHPIVIFFIGLRINRILSIVTILIIAFPLVAALSGFFISQGTNFSESFPLLIGLLTQAGIIAALYMIGLLLLGIEYAVLLAVIGALLNMIPYIGAIIAAVLPMIRAIVTKPNPWSALLVLAVYIFIQFIDNNLIVPRIVASKVKINALVSIIAVLAYGALWGYSGYVFIHTAYHNIQTHLRSY